VVGPATVLEVFAAVLRNYLPSPEVELVKKYASPKAMIDARAADGNVPYPWGPNQSDIAHYSSFVGWASNCDWLRSKFGVMPE
jgi:hypothetical protein